MDTDSAYVALSGPLEKVIKSSLRREFWESYHLWFPRQYCNKHKTDFIEAKCQLENWSMNPCCKSIYKYDERTPGLFKSEFSGHGCISLNSKTYICWNTSDSSEDKCRSKGVSRKHNKLTIDNYRSVLESKVSVSGENRGFVNKDHRIFTYLQLRKALTYFYAKRKVLSDGVSTTPLDI